MNIYSCITVALLFFLSCSQQKANKEEIPAYPGNGDITLFVVDTIDISDPILIRFEDTTSSNSKTIQSVLVSKSSLDSSYVDTKISYYDFISSRGYLFFPANSFSCLFNNLLYSFPALKENPFYSKLQTYIWDHEKDVVWVNSDKEKHSHKKFNGWEYDEIYPRKFLFCLVKGSALRQCQSIDEIAIPNLDNLYFKILMPLSN